MFLCHKSTIFCVSCIERPYFFLWKVYLFLVFWSLRYMESIFRIVEIEFLILTYKQPSITRGESGLSQLTWKPNTACRTPRAAFAVLTFACFRALRWFSETFRFPAKPGRARDFLSAFRSQAQPPVVSTCGVVYMGPFWGFTLCPLLGHIVNGAGISFSVDAAFKGLDLRYTHCWFFKKAFEVFSYNSPHLAIADIISPFFLFVFFLTVLFGFAESEFPNQGLNLGPQQLEGKS